MHGAEDACAPAKTRQRDGRLPECDALCFIAKAHRPCMVFFSIIPGFQVVSDGI